MAAQSPQDQRKARLAAALRENLKRRKAQARERSASGAEAAAESHSQDRVGSIPAQENLRRD